MNRLLMHKDKVVAEFDCSNFYVKDINIIDGFLMPFRVTDNEKTNNALFFDWKKTRPHPCSPQNFTNPLLSSIGETYEDISFYVCASLTDCYWFKPIDLNIKWQDVNYFDNQIINIEENRITFSDKMYKYTNYNDVLAPLFSNKRARALKYYTINNENKYCMARACDVLNNGRDIFNEIIGNILEDALDIDGVQYYILSHNLEYQNVECSIPLAACELCIQDDKKEMLTLNNLSKSNELSNYNLYEYLASLGFKKDIDKMIVLDYLLLNPERTLNDIGIIRDSETLCFERLAPIYNCSSAFNYYGVDSIRQNFEDYSMPFLKRHSRQISLVEDFSFVDFDALLECVDTVDAVISYSSLSNEEKQFILDTLEDRINKLQEVVTDGARDNSIQYLRAAEKINRRFNVDAIIKNTGIDPITSQNTKNLFINYLSDIGKKEFEKFDNTNPNLKLRFENFKKDTLCI